MAGLIGCSDEPKEEKIKMLTPKPPKVVEHVEPIKPEAPKEKPYAEDGVIDKAMKSGITTKNLMDF